MASAGGRLPDDVLREMVRQAVSRTSLRETARAMDAWPSALRKFLNGSVPRDSTRQRLHEWYMGQAGSLPSLSAETAETGLDLLLQGLTGRRRATARERILSMIEAAHRDQRTEPPPWISDLRGGSSEPEE
jgi:hypothetical protein